MKSKLLETKLLKAKEVFYRTYPFMSCPSKIYYYKMLPILDFLGEYTDYELVLRKDHFLVKIIYKNKNIEINYIFKNSNFCDVWYPDEYGIFLKELKVGEFQKWFTTFILTK